LFFFLQRAVKFNEVWRDYVESKNKRQEFVEETLLAETPQIWRFIAIEVLLAILAFGTALLGFLATDNNNYSYKVEQICIVILDNNTPIPTSTLLPTPTITQETIAPTWILTTTSTLTNTSIPTLTSTFTPSPTWTLAATNTFTPTVTATLTLLPTNTFTPTAPPTDTATPPANALALDELEAYEYWFSAQINREPWQIWRYIPEIDSFENFTFGLPVQDGINAYQPARSPDG
jgi:hypothetical protein